MDNASRRKQRYVPLSRDMNQYVLSAKRRSLARISVLAHLALIKYLSNLRCNVLHTNIFFPRDLRYNAATLCMKESFHAKGK